MTVTDDRVRYVEFPALKEAQGKLDAKRDQLASALREAAEHNYDMSRVKSLDGDSTAKVEQIKAWNAEIDDLKKVVDGHLVVAKAAWEAKEYGAARESGAQREDEGPQVKGGVRQRFGDQVLKSDAIKGYKPGQGSGPSARIDIEVKTLFSTSNGWDPEDTRTGRLAEYPTRPAPRVIDAFPQTTTGQSTVLYMEETVFVNNAQEVAEGGAYPEVQLKVEEKSSEVRKIPAFLPITEETFEDEPRARSYVENRLPFMLRQRIDLQLLVGNGTAPNLRGLENVTGIQTQALGADPIPDAIYKAMRKIRDDGFAEPSHCFIQPSKWETVRLMRTADGLYIWGHPSMVGPATIWGVPVVETTACTSTKADIGDFTNHSEVAMRRGIDIQISNSHGNYFTEGVLAVRCDVRLAVIYYRPKAFATVTGL
jgi:hypothetical protein